MSRAEAAGAADAIVALPTRGWEDAARRDDAKAGGAEHSNRRAQRRREEGDEGELVGGVAT